MTSKNTSLLFNLCSNAHAHAQVINYKSPFPLGAQV